MGHRDLLIEFAKFLDGWDMNDRNPEQVVDEFLESNEKNAKIEINTTFFLSNILRRLSVDQQISLIEQLSERIYGVCMCEKPDYELGYSYCHSCRKHLTEERLNQLEEGKKPFKVDPDKVIIVPPVLVKEFDLGLF